MLIGRAQTVAYLSLNVAVHRPEQIAKSYIAEYIGVACGAPPIKHLTGEYWNLSIIGFVVFTWRREARLPSPQNNIKSNHVDAWIYLVNAAIGYVLVAKLYDMILRLAEP